MHKIKEWKATENKSKIQTIDHTLRNEKIVRAKKEEEEEEDVLS